MRKIGLVGLMLAAACIAAGASVARGAQHSAAGHLRVANSTRIPGMLKVPGVVGTRPVGLSYNWSGWGDTSVRGKFNYVHSKFVQPAVTCDGTKNDWTSEWVGLDGFNSDTVEQDGTFSFCGGPNHRTPHYVAWYEMFPAGSVAVFNVKPGDVIEPVASYANGKFTLTISDLTSHRSASHTARCKQCLRSSAEWIEERPALCNNQLTKCFLTALANFHTAVMTEDWASIDGGKVSPVKRFIHQPLDMIQPLSHHRFEILAQTNPLFNNGSAFSVTFEQRGGILPITL